MRTIEGIVAKYNGIENIEGECLIVLNCEDNPLDDEIFPSFVLKGNYYFKSSQRVRIYYPTPIKIKEIDGKRHYIKAEKAEPLDRINGRVKYLS